MMADGTWQRMGDYDAKNQKQNAAGFSFKIGDSVSLVDPEEGSVSLTVGDEYCDNRTLTGKVRTGKLTGAEFHVCWDDKKNIWIDCNTGLSEACRVAIMLWDDGKTSPIGAQYLWGTWTDAEKDNLPAPALHFLTYDEMISLPDPQWLIDGLIMERTSALMFGKSNSYKSFLGIDLACSLATGTAWHGSEIAAPTPVLYVATEGALGVAKQRIPGWMEAHSVPHDLRQMITLYPQEIAVDDDKAITDLLQSCGIGNSHRKLARGEKVWNEKDPKGAFSLIVVDIFGASMNGPETSDETARAWVRNVNRIMREVDCAVLTIAHTGWADETRARMHTHFWGSFDTRLKAVGDKESLTTVLTVDRH